MPLCKGPRTRAVKPESPQHRWDRAILEPAFVGGAVLYRMRDRGGALLYIGVTGNPVQRWRRHAQRKPWWPQVDIIEFEDHPKEHLALEAERAAIKQEHPRYNVRSAVVR